MKKTLTIRDASATADETPAIKKKGRGWEISEKRLDALHERARDMRRHSTPAHKALAAKFAEADMGRYKFTRHAVVGSAIVDLNCHNLGLAIMIDEDDADEALAKRRDKSLESVGIRVERVAASEILENMDDVLQRLTLVMRECIAQKKHKAREHAAANPNQHYSRPNRSGGPRRNNHARD